MRPGEGSAPAEPPLGPVPTSLQKHERRCISMRLTGTCRNASLGFGPFGKQRGIKEQGQRKASGVPLHNPAAINSLYPEAFMNSSQQHYNCSDVWQVLSGAWSLQLPRTADPFHLVVYSERERLASPPSAFCWSLVNLSQLPGSFENVIMRCGCRTAQQFCFAAHLSSRLSKQRKM